MEFTAPMNPDELMRNSQDAPAGAIEEYKALRQELLQAQQSRLLILGLTSAALGAVLGIVAPTRDLPGRDKPEIVGLILFGHMVVAAACLITIHRGQAIVTIGRYIQVFIEPIVPGISWETRKAMHHSIRLSSRYRLGSSRTFAAYYAVVLLAMTGIGLYLVGPSWWWAPILLLLIVDILPIRNLWWQTSPGWRLDWTTVLMEEDRRSSVT